MADQNKTDDDKLKSGDEQDTAPSEAKEKLPSPPDAKTLARQRSKEDISRKRRDMRRTGGKR